MQQGLMASLVLHEHGIWLKSMYVAPPTLLRTDTLRAQKNSRMRAGLKGSPNRELYVWQMRMGQMELSM